MATPSPLYTSNLFFLLASLMLLSTASAFQFRVGGPRGWREPAANESETYNRWARRNRFHIGDTIYFKYEKDSVLVVDRADYTNCNTSMPLLNYTDGHTTIRFNRYGYFYFISGDSEHCRLGQKLVVRVMVHPEFIAPGPGPAPSPQQGGGGWGPDAGLGPGHSGPGSTTSDAAFIVASSAVVAVLAGFFVLIMLL